MDFPKPRTSESLRTIPHSRLLLLSTKLPNTAAAAAQSANPSKATARAIKAGNDTSSMPPKPTPIKTVLWICGYAALLETTKMMLASAGFDVHTASDFLQVEAACNEDRFQLAVVDHTLAPKIKRAIAAVIREKRKGTLILELCQVSSEIPDADYILIGHAPDALMNMVLRIAKERGE